MVLRTAARLLLVLPLLSAWIPGCAAPVGSPEEEVGVIESSLTAAQRRSRAGRIRDAAGRRGITQGWLLAGIADAETTMAHCHREATWACRGPSSADCGGGPVIAGAGDGPCSIRQGGLGMFQFDAGTYDQTLAREGRRILSIDGNVDAAVDFVIAMVIRSRYIGGVSNGAQAIAWMNGVRVDNGRLEAWARTVTRYYNGCPEGGSCWPSRLSRYRSHAVNVFHEMGASFWQYEACEATCLSGSRIRDASCGTGDCAVFGARCVDDALGARCVAAFCEARGTSKACLPDGTSIMTCRDGAPIGTGDCAAFGATCVDDALGARCVSVFCPARGTEKHCLPDGDTLITCNDGGIEGTGSCGVFGASCVEDDLGARCVAPFCEARGRAQHCVPDSEVLITCADGALEASGDCANYGATCVEDAAGARCVSVFCEATGIYEVCLPGELRARCDDGGITVLEECGPDSVCGDTGGETFCAECPPEADGTSHCAPGGIVTCDAGAASVALCPDGRRCVEDTGGASCEGEAAVEPTAPDAGVEEPDLGPRDGGGDELEGGCGVGGGDAPAGSWLALMLGVALLRRRAQPL